MEKTIRIEDADEFTAEIERVTKRFEEMISMIEPVLPDVVAEHGQLSKRLTTVIGAIEASDEAIRLADFLLRRLN